MNYLIGKRVAWGHYPDTQVGTVCETDGDMLYVLMYNDAILEVWSGHIRLIDEG